MCGGSCATELVQNWVCHVYVGVGSFLVFGGSLICQLVSYFIANDLVCAQLFVWLFFVLSKICLVRWFVLVVCLGDCVVRMDV